ncbi:response regulator transcription factor [Bifidobacterium asteroides]|uniref:response regulator transcription factor n=1 Tax=Bifidobacterium asteroides TaxID=1684 RepID=UPI0020C567DE|nr:response regulator transcription factor [Bifidobacterium asteroides]MCP8614086.1 response regulator transcription factor [Bifidobacterium asteroides]
MPTILVVEDQEDIQSLLKDVLGGTYRIIQATTGAQALACFQQEEPDLILLDLMLPVVTGDSVLKAIRHISSVPVIILTAIQDKTRTVSLLEQGANDYVTKPFDIDELRARVRVQLRQSGALKADADAAGESDAKMCFQGIELDRMEHTVSVDGHRVELARKEFAILELLMDHPHRVFEKEDLYRQVWNQPYINAENTLNVHLSTLRTSLNRYAGSQRYIVSVWGIGVRLV